MGDQAADTADSKGRAVHFVAVFVYESSSDAADYRPTYEESFVLIRAVSEEEARAKAQEYAKRPCISYENCYGQMITWSLKHVLHVTQVLEGDLIDGVELYSRFFRNYEA